MADPTVLGQLSDLETKAAQLHSQMAALETKVDALRQLLEDVQIAILHIQDTLGTA